MLFSSPHLCLWRSWQTPGFRRVLFQHIEPSGSCQTLSRSTHGPKDTSWRSVLGKWRMRRLAGMTRTWGGQASDATFRLAARHEGGMFKGFPQCTSENFQTGENFLNTDSCLESPNKAFHQMGLGMLYKFLLCYSPYHYNERPTVCFGWIGALCVCVERQCHWTWPLFLCCYPQWRHIDA